MTKKKLEDQFPGHDLDKPVEITYTDGEKVTLPTLRQMLEEQQKLEDFADEMLGKMGFAPRTP